MVIPCLSRKELVQQQIDRKIEIERNISEHGQILIANKNVGMNESLLVDGYPRNDIDVYQVRQARHAIICLQNDLKQIMKDIEVGLIAIHAEALVNREASTKMSNMQIDDENQGFEGPMTSQNTAGFAKIDFISPASPSEMAGIRVNDEILQFGSITTNNFSNLGQIAEIMRHSENQQLEIRVKRNNRVHVLSLIPKKWAGRGLVGCNLSLIK